jgi:hypothetical protein
LLWFGSRTRPSKNRTGGDHLAREVALLLCSGFLSLFLIIALRTNQPSFAATFFNGIICRLALGSVCDGLRISSIVRRMGCPEYLRLRHRYEACLKRWAQPVWPSHGYELFPISAHHAAEIRAIASTERKAAHERMYVHQKNCPACKPLGNTARPPGLS